MVNDNGLMVWYVVVKELEWFLFSQLLFMINYWVDDLDELLVQLQSKGIEIEVGLELYENGKFVWIMDLEGNKIELW